MSKFRAGDHVKHRPSGESWIVAAVTTDGDGLLPYGWPETIANATDCEMEKSATDEEHRNAIWDWLGNSASTGHDYRRSLNREVAVSLGIAEYVPVPCERCKGTGQIVQWQIRPASR